MQVIDPSVRVIVGTLESLPPLRTEDLMYDARTIDLPVDASEAVTEDMFTPGDPDVCCAGCGTKGHDYFTCPEWFTKYRSPLV